MHQAAMLHCEPQNNFVKKVDVAKPQTTSSIENIHSPYSKDSNAESIGLDGALASDVTGSSDPVLGLLTLLQPSLSFGKPIFNCTGDASCLRAIDRQVLNIWGQI